MSIARLVRRREIREIVHFTPSKGLLGIVAARAVLSRSRIYDEDVLEYIAAVNAQRVLDPGYEDYVHLSITGINSSFFDASARWYPDHSWALIAFDPEILQHEGVLFCTTNNAYPAVIRGSGKTGLEAMFAPSVRGRYNTLHTRRAGMPDYLTTDEQAEVLYPQRLSTDYLRVVYVRDENFAEQVEAHFGGVNHRKVPIEVAPDRFRHHGDRGR